MRRRQLLTTGSAALVLTLAGCTDETDDGNGTREEGSTDQSDDGNGDGNGTGNAGDDQLVELLEHEWYNNGSYDAGVTGRLENVSGEELSYVGVEVYFLDEEGTQIGEGLDNTTDLADGRVWEFDAMYTEDNPQRVDNYEITTDVTNY